MQTAMLACPRSRLEPAWCRVPGARLVRGTQRCAVGLGSAACKGPPPDAGRGALEALGEVKARAGVPRRSSWATGHLSSSATDVHTVSQALPFKFLGKTPCKPLTGHLCKPCRTQVVLQMFSVSLLGADSLQINCLILH